jgi:hypothetical protein
VLAFSGLNSLAPSAPIRRRSTVARVSDAAISLGLASRRSSCLATSRPRHARCVRPTSVSHHTLRAPASRGFLSRREVALARSRGAGVSRCHLRFGGPFADPTSGDFPSMTPAKNRASDAPVASPCMKRGRFRTHRLVRGRQDRLRRVFVKRARLHDPERLPSAGDSVSRSTARGLLRPLTRYGPCLRRSRGFATTIRSSMHLRAPLPLASGPRGPSASTERLR